MQFRILVFIYIAAFLSICLHASEVNYIFSINRTDKVYTKCKVDRVDDIEKSGNFCLGTPDGLLLLACKRINSAISVADCTLSSKYSSNTKRLAFITTDSQLECETMLSNLKADVMNIQRYKEVSKIQFLLLYNLGTLR